MAGSRGPGIDDGDPPRPHHTHLGGAYCTNAGASIFGGVDELPLHHVSLRSIRPLRRFCRLLMSEPLVRLHACDALSAHSRLSANFIGTSRSFAFAQSNLHGAKHLHDLLARPCRARNNESVSLPTSRHGNLAGSSRGGSLAAHAPPTS